LKIFQNFLSGNKSDGITIIQSQQPAADPFNVQTFWLVSWFILQANFSTGRALSAQTTQAFALERQREEVIRLLTV
jgi:hypothetical protein